MKTKRLQIGLFVSLLVFTGCMGDDTTYNSDVPVTDFSDEEVQDDNNDVVNENETDNEVDESEAEDQVVEEEPENSTTNENVRDSVNLGLQFYAQAPTGDWGEPYQEACEESSLILAHNYVTGTEMTLSQFDQEIQKLVKWQNENYGSYKDTNVSETAGILEGVYGYSNYTILENPTADDLVRELNAGHPIVAPFAGRDLGNPYFSGAGPIYHMLVIKGYEKKNGELTFITNDVGTKRGESFMYSEATLMGALHDWVEGSKSDPSKMRTGKKTVLVLK